MGLFAKRTLTEAQEVEEARWAERRADTRHDVEVRVDFGTDHNFYQGFTENVSEGGLFVATYRRLSRGERVVVRLYLNEGEPVEVSCTVRWTRDDSEAGPGGMGLQFETLDAETAARIAAFVACRDPLFYED